MYNLDNLINKINEYGGQKKVSEDLNMPQSSLSDLLNKEKSLPKSVIKLCKLREYFNCSLDFLLGLENNIIDKQEEKLLNLFNQLDEDYKKQAISQVLKLVIKMSNEQDEIINSKKAQIAALGGGVTEISPDLAKYIRENAVVDEFDPNN